MYLLPDELNEPNLKYENENMYNLFNLIKRDEKQFLNGDKVVPDALADDLGEFKEQSKEERKTLFQALISPMIKMDEKFLGTPAAKYRGISRNGKNWQVQMSIFYEKIYLC